MNQTNQKKQPTHEQEDVINAVRLGIPNIEVGAFAGTGKTSLLEMNAERMPAGADMLYIVFNKSNEIEAKERFSNYKVVVKTINALAFGAVAQRNENINFYRRQDIERIFSVNGKDANVILKGFETFCNSSYLSVPTEMKKSAYIQDLYDKMDRREINPTHSYMLKKFHISLAKGHNLKNIRKYDLVMADEWQDTNPVTASIVNLIDTKVLIKVGDKHQGIYGFRGANNIMGKDKESQSFFLTNSFRFNQEIADKANAILSIYKGEDKKLKGSGTKTRLQSACLLSRTNSELIVGAKKLVEAKKVFKTIRKPELIFDLAISISVANANMPEKIRKSCKHIQWEYDKYKKSNHSSFLEYLDEDSKQLKDQEIRASLKIVKDIKLDKLFEVEGKAIEYFNADHLHADYFLSTIHTSKGLEWDYVRIADDLREYSELIGKHILESYGDIGDVKSYNFIQSFRSDVLDGEVNKEIVEEFNLLYVAITRAKVMVEYSESIADMLNESKFEISVQKAYQKMIEDLPENKKDALLGLNDTPRNDEDVLNEFRAML